MESLRDILGLIRVEPSNPIHFNTLGLHYEQMGNLGEALRSFQRAIDVAPDYLEALINKARTLEALNRDDDALKAYGQALVLEPQSALINTSIGLIHKRAGRFDEALVSFRKALTSSPRDVSCHVNLGILLHEMGLVDEAIACYSAALYYNPYNCEAHNNIAIALKDNHRLEEAFRHFEEALSICPHSPDINWNYGLALLLAGRYIDGFVRHELRWLKNDYRQYWRDLGAPLWEGNSTGRTILIHAEQGMGDAIQFIRYVKLLKERGLRVTVQCHRELVSLFRNVEGVTETLSFDEPLPPFDCHCPIMSLPYLFKTTLETIPASVPYITASNNKLSRWATNIGPTKRLKIGLVWAGSKEHKNDPNRSIGLRQLRPLLELDNAKFYSLQKGDGAREALGYTNIIDYTSEIEDFSDTAAFIANLDLIITVDTAVAHLAGAMAKQVWILLPFSPDWRWMLHRRDSPWYPSARLFRQSNRGDWSGVIEEVLREWNRLN